MLFDYCDVAQEVKENAKKLVERIDYTFYQIIRYSNHPDDNYLYLVIGKGGVFNGFACWLYNDSLNSLNSGHYDLDVADIIDVLNKSIRKI